MTAPEPIEIHTDRSTAERAARAGRTGLLGGVGLFLACALVCCLPLLTAAAAAIGLGAIAAGAWVLGAGALVAAGVAMVLVRRRRGTAHDGTSSCGCGGSCAC